MTTLRSPSANCVAGFEDDDMHHALACLTDANPNDTESCFNLSSLNNLVEAADEDVAPADLGQHLKAMGSTLIKTNLFRLTSFDWLMQILGLFNFDPTAEGCTMDEFREAMVSLLESLNPDDSQTEGDTFEVVSRWQDSILSGFSAKCTDQFLFDVRKLLVLAHTVNQEEEDALRKKMDKTFAQGNVRSPFWTTYQDHLKTHLQIADVPTRNTHLFLTEEVCAVLAATGFKESVSRKCKESVLGEFPSSVWENACIVLVPPTGAGSAETFRLRDMVAQGNMEDWVQESTTSFSWTKKNVMGGGEWWWCYKENTAVNLFIAAEDANAGVLSVLLWFLGAQDLFFNLRRSSHVGSPLKFVASTRVDAGTFVLTHAS